MKLLHANIVLKN